MKSVTASVFLVLVLYNVVSGDKYTDKYDNVDIDSILKNDRLLMNYINCLLDKGTCTPDGQELKTHLGDAIENACEKCSEKQKEGVKKVVIFIAKNKPDEWKALCEKYDPEGKHRKKYAEELKAEGIEV